MLPLRPYQRAAVEAALNEMRRSVEPIVIDAAPASGKSFMIAGIAHELHSISGGKKVLCLAPGRELVIQNHEKYLQTGEPASIFSASAGSKSTRHPVVFATPQTVTRSLSRFLDGYCAVVIDECHGITPTIKSIVAAMKERNPNLRVIGLSGTPYRLNEGYVYRIEPDGRILPEDQAANPYFAKCVIRIPAKEMLDTGFLCHMQIGTNNANSYDTSALVLDNKGQFTAESLDRAFVGKGRETSLIVADVIEQARQFGDLGVMFFAATVQHAKEIMESLPSHNSGFVYGEDAQAAGGKYSGRKAVIDAYRNKKFRYLVSVGTLTTGFDVTHTAIIAMLRRTESAALFQQIMGRAWRLDPDKTHSLLLDYAGNVDNHFPDGDIYKPVIRASIKKEAGDGIECVCPLCSGINTFGARPNPSGYQIDKAGYFVDLSGHRIEVPDVGPMPAHYGRRCLNLIPVGGGKLDQCQYRYTSKECPHCQEPNDIAARYCTICKGEIIDPNAKLAVEFRALKRSPYNRQCDEVLKCDVRETVSQSGKPIKRVDFVTPYRSFSIWLQLDPRHPRAYSDLQRWNALDGELPKTVEYQKNQDGFFTVFSYNKPADVEPVT